MAGAAILLMGPTGAGKSDAAVALAERLPLDIISVDSAMVYRGLDIGTAKPGAATRARVPHALIDIREPSERFSAGEFLREAEPAMAASRARGRVPLLVGGTMLYFRALRAGRGARPPPTPVARARPAARAAVEGWAALHAELAGIDAAAAGRIRPNDAQRIQRALEVHALTGTPLSVLQRQDLRGAVSADSLTLVLAPRERDALSIALERRFEAMLRAGLLQEVAALPRSWGPRPVAAGDPVGRLPAAVGAPRRADAAGRGTKSGGPCNSAARQASVHVAAGRTGRRMVRGGRSDAHREPRRPGRGVDFDALQTVRIRVLVFLASGPTIRMRRGCPVDYLLWKATAAAAV